MWIRPREIKKMSKTKANLQLITKTTIKAVITKETIKVMIIKVTKIKNR